MENNYIKMQFALCMRNEECNDIEPQKIYRILPDDASYRKGYLRVIDDSKQNFLYPAEYFILLDLPQKDVNRLMTRL